MVELEEEETLAGKAGAGGAPRRTDSARRCCVRASLSVGPVAPRLVPVVSRIPSVTIGFLSVV